MDALLRIAVGALALTAPLLAQPRTEVVYGGFPAPQSSATAPVATHVVQSYPETFQAFRSVTVPQFDPVLGFLQSVELRLDAAYDYGICEVTSIPSFTGRTVSLQVENQFTFHGPGFREVGARTSSVTVQLPRLATTTGFGFPRLPLSRISATIQSPSVDWVGTGSVPISVVPRSEYTTSSTGLLQVTWPFEANAQVEVIYHYLPAPDGSWIRGLPGRGLGGVRFVRLSNDTYTLRDDVRFDSRYREGSQLLVGDDSFVDISLPFLVQMPASIRRPATLRVHADGFLSDPFAGLQSFGTPTVQQFLRSSSPILAPCWQDFSPSQGGAIWFRSVSPVTTSITWEAVPEAGRTNSNTFQVQLSSNGMIAFLYADMNLEAPGAIVGISGGRRQATSTTIDFSSVPGSTILSIPATTYEFFSGVPDIGADPAQPVLVGRTPPNQGTTYELGLENAPTATAASLFAGFPSSLDLGSVFGGAGLDGSFLRVNLGTAVSLPMPIGAPLFIAIPPDPSLRGVRTEMQAVTLDPQASTNVLGLMLSNALTAVVGG